MANGLKEALLDKKVKAEYNKLLPHQKKDVPSFVILGLINAKLKKKAKKESTKKGQ